jgi:hypothetical protein
LFIISVSVNTVGGYCFCNNLQLKAD